MNRKKTCIFFLLFLLLLSACGKKEETVKEEEVLPVTEAQADADDYPQTTEEISGEVSVYTDENEDIAYIPAGFRVSEKEDERTIDEGLVIIGPDNSEYVWIPTTETPLAQREFYSYFSGGRLENYEDEVTALYQEMKESVLNYGGYYIGRYETSWSDDRSLPASKAVTENSPGNIIVQYSPQDFTELAQKLYENNSTVQAFFTWGANWDTALQWLADSGALSFEDVSEDSTSWGNYSNDSFSIREGGKYTGKYEEAKVNNIYDLAGNNWEWTQERCGSSYVMRSGGYNLMGGSCEGDRYPAAIRDPLPGNNHHPNVTFRLGLYVK